MREELTLSRRQILSALATTGAGASLGGGTVALVTDSEGVESSLTAGSLDLTVEGGNSAAVGVSDSDAIELDVSVGDDDNSAYVWLGGCAPCTDVEEALFVTLVLTSDADEGLDEELFSGPLDDFRDTYGTGDLVTDAAGDPLVLDPGVTWTVRVEWTVAEPVMSDEAVQFDFDFHTVQRRHVDDPQVFSPDGWTCDVDCDDDDNGGSCETDISYVAFCGSETVAEDDFAFERTSCGDGSTKGRLVVTDVPDSLSAVLLKYGTWLDVFEYDGESTPFTLHTGGQDSDLTLEGTYEQDQGNEYSQTNSVRSNSDSCPGDGGFKYEFGADVVVAAEDDDEDGGEDDDEMNGNGPPGDQGQGQEQDQGQGQDQDQDQEQDQGQDQDPSRGEGQQ